MSALMMLGLLPDAIKRKQSYQTFPCLIIYLFYFHQDEPAVITLDNIAQFIGQQQRPDVFNVNVQAVLKTRDAQREQGRV